MTAIFGLILLLPFFLLGYFGYWRVTFGVVGLLGLWLGYVGYLHWTGDPSDPSLNEHGAQVFPYFLGVLIAAILLAHVVGWGVRCLKALLEKRRADASVGETFK
jgi:hypothetical protein